MVLHSELFTGDRRLEACLVQDSAHLLVGSQGEHVGKIQTALAILEGALIAESEISNRLYGQTTARAVLAYKRKRNIINFSYQQQADDIVGKMTIAALDKEMAEGEGREARRCCPDPGRGRVRPERLALSDVRAPGQPVPGRFMAVIFQIVRIGDQTGPKTFEIPRATVARANELMAPRGLSVRAIVGLSLTFPRKVKFPELDEFTGLRKAAEAAMPGMDGFLRVLLCPFRLNEREDDFANNAASFDISPFQRFVVINTNLLRADGGTLLHEMIHCSTPFLMGDEAHDPRDSGSIFSVDAARDKLPAKFVSTLSQAFFAHGPTAPG